MNQKFIIIAQPRTGSTLVSSLLSSINEVRCIVEPINPIGHVHHMQPNGQRIVPQSDLRNISSVINRLLSEDKLPNEWDMSYKTAKKAAGFKIMVHQILSLHSPDQFWQHIRNIQCKLLLIIRKNKLMQIISDQIAKNTKQPAVWEGIPATQKVYINTSNLTRQLENISKQEQYMISQSSYFNKKIIYYEDFKDEHQNVARILPWLIDENHHLTTSLRKQNPDDIKERVINYEQLVSIARHLNIQHMLE